MQQENRYQDGYNINNVDSRPYNNEYARYNNRYDWDRRSDSRPGYPYQQPQQWAPQPTPTSFRGPSGRPDYTQYAEPQQREREQPTVPTPENSYPNYAVYDPVTKQRTTLSSNCTSRSSCVPKCLAERGPRVCYYTY